jgi:hypothetical protein
VAFIIWLVAGVGNASSGGAGGLHATVVAQCANAKTGAASMGETQAQCISLLGGALKVGASIGAGLIVIVWVLVDFFVGLGYGIYRLARR